jgi:hypothetical protein
MRHPPNDTISLIPTGPVHVLRMKIDDFAARLMMEGAT